MTAAEQTRLLVLAGGVAGASAGAIAGWSIWALRTLPKAYHCEVSRGIPVSGGGGQSCDRHIKRRTRYVWTGLLIGSTIGGVIGRLLSDSNAGSDR